MSKPEVYKPLLLIITITCLQHFSGFTFTKKFLLQILAPAKKLEVGGEVPNEPEEEEEEEEEYTGYYFAILINTIRTAANLLMSDFLKRSKVAKYQMFSSEKIFVLKTQVQCLLPKIHQIYSYIF